LCDLVLSHLVRSCGRPSQSCHVLEQSEPLTCLRQLLLSSFPRDRLLKSRRPCHNYFGKSERCLCPFSPSYVSRTERKMDMDRARGCSTPAPRFLRRRRTCQTLYPPLARSPGPKSLSPSLQRRLHAVTAPMPTTAHYWFAVC
jgi:hypothetical protein